MTSTRQRRRSTGARRRFGFVFLIIATPMLLAACTVPAAPALKRGVADFSPSSTNNAYHYDIYSYNGGLCGFNGRGTLTVAPPGRLLVGFDNSFEPGSGPFPCISKIDHAYRGGVRFDVSALTAMKQIVIEKAVLTWTIERAEQRDAAGNPRGITGGPSATNCVGPVLESSESIFTPNVFLSGYSLRTGPGDVTSLVTSWVVNKEPNYGFVLVGTNESYQRNNAACLNYIINPHLHIDFLFP